MTATPARILLDRYDELTVWPFPKWLMFAIGMGFFFSFFDILTISFTLPVIIKQFHISFSVAAWVISAGLLGYVFGSLSISFLSDHVGRRIGLYISLIFFSVGALGCALSDSIYSMVFWRFITGFGIGAEISCATAYLTEIAPSSIRGKIAGRSVACGMFAFSVAPFVALAIVPHVSFGWRILFAIGAVGAVFMVCMRYFMPESPRFLSKKGKLKELEQFVIGAETYAKAHEKEKKSLQMEASSSVVDTGGHKRYFFRLVQFMLIWFFYYIGNYAWLTMGTTLLYQHGYTLSKSLWMVALSSLGFITGALLTPLFIDRFERKRFAMGILSVWVVALLLIGWVDFDAVIVVAGFFATTSIAMIIPTLYLYTGEHFPTLKRAFSVAVTDGVGHLGAAFCAQIVMFFAMLSPKPEHFSVALTVMAVTGIVALLLLMLGTKTQGRRVV